MLISALQQSDSVIHIYTFFSIMVYHRILNIVPWNGWLLNNRNVFLTVLEAGKSKNKVLADSGSGEGLLSGP